MNELDNMRIQWEYDVFGESGTHEWDETKLPQLGLLRETSLTKESGNAPTYAHKVSQTEQVILHVMQWWSNDDWVKTKNCLTLGRWWQGGNWNE